MLPSGSDKVLSMFDKLDMRRYEEGYQLIA
jgi:hypothetical protein